MSVILKAENISKQYRLGVVGTGTLSDDLKRWWFNIRGKEDPFLKIGAVNDRGVKAEEDYIWALKDINFEVKHGEVLGIIGKNGAGKSTLLKILSRITSPTTGVIKSKGRIASLLEVGTGFHGELTGRENIFMNGTVLGMTRAEIKNKIDEIIAFSGCEKYIDTPVKRYSSGMTVRLGFAVAAHLEPEILVVDEVLAVGDAEFQKKAIGKMKDLSSGEGRTVLFVSHNMVSVQNLCSRCLVLTNGRISFDGEVDKAIEEYLVDEFKNDKKNLVFPLTLKEISVENFQLTDSNLNLVYNLISGNDYLVSVLVKNNSIRTITFDVRLQLFYNEELISTLNSFHQNVTFSLPVNQCVEFKCLLKKIPITPGKYNVGLEIFDRLNEKIIYENKYFSKINVHEGDFYKSGRIPSRNNFGRIFLDYDWNVHLKSF